MPSRVILGDDKTYVTTHQFGTVIRKIKDARFADGTTEGGSDIAPGNVVLDTVEGRVMFSADDVRIVEEIRETPVP